MSEIDLGELDIFEMRIIMLRRLKLDRVKMAEICDVSTHHYREWMKGARESPRLQKMLEDRYLSIKQEKS